MASSETCDGTQRDVKWQSEATQTTSADSTHPIITTDNIENTVLCNLCNQIQIENVKILPNAESECIVLANELLANIFTDNVDIIHNLTDYSIYCENKHMSAIDSGVMERDVPLYLTGYVKPIYDNSPNIEKGIAAKELGPILEWYLTSYDGGSEVVIGVATDFAHYLLIEPSSMYKKYMTSIIEKIQLSRLVIKSILINEDDNPTYEDILNIIIESENPATGAKFSEEDLITHAQFVLDQVTEYDANDTYYLPLGDTQCIVALAELSGAVKRVKARLQRGGLRPRSSIMTKREFSKATTTELVKDVFEKCNIFADQLDIDDEENKKLCVKTVFGDTKKKVSFDLNNSDENQVMWKGEKLCVKMFIAVKQNASQESVVGRIEYLYKKNGENMAHILLFMYSCETLLGEVADSQEMVALKKCTNIQINNIVKVLDVIQKIPSNDWFSLGGSKLENLLDPVNRNNQNSLFYQMQYDDKFGRFEYPKAEDPCHVQKDKYCSNCEADDLERKSQIPELLEFIEKSNYLSYFYKVKLHNEEYKVGNFIYLPPGIFKSASRSNFFNEKIDEELPFVNSEENTNQSDQLLKDIDETMYPEYYRKSLENTLCGSNETTPGPFEIVEILAIYKVDWDMENIRLNVRRMYRAEQVLLEDCHKNADINMLLWSDEEFRIPCEFISGKCYVAFIGNIENVLDWSAGGPDRFYFENKYDILSGSIIPKDKLTSDTRATGIEVNVNFNHKYVNENKLQYIPSYKKIRPLSCLDIFAGCGGLSKGLEDSGLIKSKWAIESDEKAAVAFELNNPESTVFVEDCNHLLKLAMSGSTENDKNQKIPQKGEVDLICGGPPCQGFSGMNRFNSGQYSSFKNSLIVSFLSYIDYYRPKYFVMENVRNFVSFKKNMALKLTLRCIARIGYQCTFGILQAGNFGVPQTRRRLIIMAAAPGEQLPLYPEPTHVFRRKGSSLNVQVGDIKFITNCKYNESAPMRTVTVYDAWSDLPEILNGASLEKITYNSKPNTHLQKLLRCSGNQFTESTLTDHICKDMSPLVQARMELIPVGEGSDWRDLPNIVVKRSDGIFTNKLLYCHHDSKNGKGKNSALRGVCKCATIGEKCNPQDRQNNTIIPWCLPHTGNRHNNWAGLYGRLAWEGFCSTTITNPEPMGKQGRVLHPDQHRVVSVRECARSQGFKDSYLFYGSIINKHRQIGNAVPPPMGKAIGHEIIKAIYKNPESLCTKIEPENSA